MTGWHLGFEETNRILAPGDYVLLSALARDVAKARPGAPVYIRARHTDLWQHNPHFAPLPHPPPAGVKTVEITYGRAYQEANRRPIHLLRYFYEDFQKKAGWLPPQTAPHGDIVLSPEERARPPRAGAYWILAAGGKTDMPVKIWAPARWQALATALVARGILPVQIGGKRSNHINPKLTGVLDQVGRTSLRQLIHWIAHAEMVVCGVSLPMHLAAALGRPCIVIAGGREPVSLYQYHRDNEGLGPPPVRQRLAVDHQVLHAIGQLDCCATRACLHYHFGDNARLPSTRACRFPVRLPGDERHAACMDRYGADDVLAVAGLAVPAAAVPTPPPPAPPPVVTRPSQDWTVLVYLEGVAPRQPFLAQLAALAAAGGVVRLGWTAAVPMARVPSGVVGWEDVTRRGRGRWLAQQLPEIEGPVLLLEDQARLSPAMLQELLAWMAAEDLEITGGARLRPWTRPQLHWAARSPWYRKRPWLDRYGQELSNGIHVPGWDDACLVLGAGVAARLGFPDPRLRSAGIGQVLGAMAHQAGARAAAWPGAGQWTTPLGPRGAIPRWPGVNPFEV